MGTSSDGCAGAADNRCRIGHAHGAHDHRICLAVRSTTSATTPVPAAPRAIGFHIAALWRAGKTSLSENTIHHLGSNRGDSGIAPSEMRQMRLLPALGSAIAGAVGFLSGYYAAFFVVLSFWGLGFDASFFPLAVGIPAGLAAGGAIALTVAGPRRLPAFLIAGGLGVILTVLIMVLNGDAGAMLVWGVVLMVATSLIVRSGLADPLAGT